MGVGKGNMWVGERVGVGMKIGERGRGDKRRGRMGIRNLGVGVGERWGRERGIWGSGGEMGIRGIEWV